MKKKKHEPMRVNAYLPGGQMVASVYSKPVTRNKKPDTAWQANGDTGGLFDRLETWMEKVCIEQGTRYIRFMMVIPTNEKAPPVHSIYEWQPIRTAPEGVVVMTRIDSKAGSTTQQALKRVKNLWFFPDMSAYVYYTPMYWRAMCEKPLTYKEREAYACKVCGNVPDEDGMIEHGRGCFVASEDGGGTSFVDMGDENA